MKRIFWNVNTLIALSVGLLVVVFMTIGMSFTPVEEETVVEQNDTITTLAKRRSHWSTSYCGTTTNHNKNDYAEITAVTSGNGSVTIHQMKVGSLTATQTKKTTSDAGNSVAIPWNCNASTEGHTNTFQVKANPDGGYVFDHWEIRDINGTSQGKDNPLDYQMTIPNGNRGDSQNNEYESDSNPYRVSIKAFFVQKKEAQITLTATSGGTYTYESTSGTLKGTISSTSQKTITTDETIVFSATPEKGYQFFAWNAIDENGDKQVLSFNSDFKTAFSENTTIEAEFFPADMATFVIKGTTDYYIDLNKACEAALSSTSKTVVLAETGTLYPGEYTVPEGVTLLIPFDKDYTVYTAHTKENIIPNAAPTGQKPFRILTMQTNAMMVVKGDLCLGGKQTANQPLEGTVSGPFGQIVMQEGSLIEMQSGSNLYAWGYITGEGQVVAQSGATVNEDFQMTEWGGGTAAMWEYVPQKLFPFSQYYVQNIEVLLTIKAGAKEVVWACVAPSTGVVSSAVNFIADDGLFRLESGYITKKYDVENDRQLYTLNGNAQLASMKLDFSSIKMDTKEYELPINSNISITVETGTATVVSKIGLLPDTKLTIKDGASLKIARGAYLYVYDRDDWCGKNLVVYGKNGDVRPIEYTPSNPTILSNPIRTSAKLQDACIDIQGTLECYGKVYTTNGGAHICCSKGEGKFQWISTPGDATTTKQSTQSGSSVTPVTIALNPAQLFNINNLTDPYTRTINTTPQTYTYSIAQKKWVTDDEYQGYFGEELDMVDWTTNGPVFNMTDFEPKDWTAILYDGISYSKESFSIENGKLTFSAVKELPSGKTFQLKVLNAAGEQQSYHEYTVPYVINENTVVSDLPIDYTSSIFVHSGGKLTINQNVMAVDIVVDPGATIELSPDVMLTIGNKLVLRTSPTETAIIINNEGTFIDGPVYYSRIIQGADAGKTNQIAFPYEVDLTKVVLSNGKEAKFGKKFGLLEYNGEQRATNGANGNNWTAVNPRVENPTMTATKGYQIMSPYAEYHEFCFPISLPDVASYSVNVTTQTTGNDSDRGWNFVCSPFTDIYTMSQAVADPSKMLKVVLYEQPQDGEAYCYQTALAELQPAKPFFYQASANGTLNFGPNSVDFIPAEAEASLVKQKLPPTLMANVQTQWLQLYYGTNQLGADEANVYLHPMRFTTDYQTGYDMVKFSTSGARSFVWADMPYGKMAFAALPDSVATEMGIALTVFAPTAQAMTFSLRENDWLSRLQSVYLLDREQQTLTDLLQNDYSYDAAAGTTAGRFVVYPMFRAPDMTDGVELPDTTVISFTAYGTNREIWVNGLSVGMALRCYDLMGRLVYDRTADSDMMTIAVPAPGIYFVQAMDEVQKVIVR